MLTAGHAGMPAFPALAALWDGASAALRRSARAQTGRKLLLPGDDDDEYYEALDRQYTVSGSDVFAHVGESGAGCRE